jgi:hypothetical protein
MPFRVICGSPLQVRMNSHENRRCCHRVPKIAKSRRKRGLREIILYEPARCPNEASQSKSRMPLRFLIVLSFLIWMRQPKTMRRFSCINLLIPFVGSPSLTGIYSLRQFPVAQTASTRIELMRRTSPTSGRLCAPPGLGRMFPPCCPSQRSVFPRGTPAISDSCVVANILCRTARFAAQPGAPCPFVRPSAALPADVGRPWPIA